jgi:hypothetical protein
VVLLAVVAPTLLYGKEWLLPAYIQQDRPVLLMCFYCFMNEEEVCHSDTAAVACGESSSGGMANSSKASLTGISSVADA